MSGYTRGYDVGKIGLLALFASGAFLALFLYMTNRGLALRRSELFVRLPNAAGLRKGDPVNYRGVQVGEVGRIEFTTAGAVLVRAKLLEPLPLTRSAWGELVAVDLFGRQSLVLVDGTGSTIRLESGDTVHGLTPTSVGATMAELGAKADRIMGDTTVLLVRDLLTSTALASRQLTALSATLERLVHNQHETLSAITRDAAVVTHNLALVTAPEPWLQTGQNLQHATARLDTITARVSTILGEFEHSDGTIGRLLRDPTLYERGNGLLTSMEALMKDLKANPKRYINVRVF